MNTDPFGTQRLREAVLAAWSASPTRFREDANAEEDLRLGAYRDRLLVELAQNAADAAGFGGRLRLSIVDNELRAANTGAPLDAEGVAALASLRASAKRDILGTVGQFGVGFSAVLSVTDEPEVVSTTGAVRFSARRTREIPEIQDHVAARSGQVPVLRMVWPTDSVVPEGFDTEVRLPLRPDVDHAALLENFREQAPDLLLALPGLASIEVGGSVWTSTDSGDTVVLTGPEGTTRWMLRRATGKLSDTAGLGMETSTEWMVCWAVPVTESGVPQPLTEDVLHAPTPTDERLSLPARLLASLPIEASRRHVMSSPAVQEVLAEAAKLYPSLVFGVPAMHRTALVPVPGFPRSDVDAQLRDLLIAELRTQAWLPGVTESLKPASARVLEIPSDALADLLSDVVPNLAAAQLAAPEHAHALAALEISRLRIPEIVAALTGIDQEPSWWRQVYAAIAPFAENDSAIRDNLSGLPVPLVDGRTLPGPRGTLLADEPEFLSDLDVPGLRLVHPAAAHPLLERLGARHAGAAELLDALQEAVERSVADASAGLIVSGLAHAVLGLVGQAGGRPWLKSLALPDSDGDWRAADELALPGSRFLEVLDPDSPLGLLDPEFAERWSADVLSAVGVLTGFAVIVDEEPIGPEHDLADEDEWWSFGTEEPKRVVAVRDLDLVADDKWPDALRLLALEPATWQALREPGGYTAWWISRYALLDGRAPRFWRTASAHDLVGLYDPLPIELGDELAAAAGVRTHLEIKDASDAEDLLERLGDPARSVSHGVSLRAHAALAGSVDVSLLDAPERVRVLSGEAVDAEDCVVLDAPWLLAVLPPNRVVAALDDDAAEPLAELLDLPLASESAGDVTGGELVPWAELGAVVVAAELLGFELPLEGVIVHDQLTANGQRVHWWVDRQNRVHCEDTPDGLARALAWASDHWIDRHVIHAILEDPDPRTVLA
ncbi:sacsin N-terminal ATP-binding-like domain-containing protein [Kibdelosporangium aridum]|uniref:Molecular chaperone Hsp90 n=1 Tax=Kibdelosporangium aridum TaxID=2030 RepID=A0A1Y5YBU1_KIBAR|nr:hypothetical protein [Kibdelosporangium aridum]SMD26832.1 hypothetical protein SAMN05661093_10419 [Kibdelosporangium aridum]